MRNPTMMAARLRGAFVGSAAAAVSIAAHALGGGTMAPGAAPVALLIAACAAVGVLAGARPHRHGIGEMMATLAVAQAVAHIASTLSAPHQHDARATSVMLGTHLAAVPLGALLIRAAEHAVLRAASDVRRTVRVLGEGPSAPVRIGSPAFEHAPPHPRRPLLGSGCGLRGPPPPR
ncbi:MULTISPECIES: hypothetical protein [Nocardia]|uniref:Uncharacterized protein n=1 Tax=Nocardia implantans TaxID=3108168 RepID=A0ABU6B3J1_9NOCA|nr:MULTISPECIES: hypothetical protein [unclassified Nocardia]MBF6195997.1 hypothetical protein [Nocardia beijingensis]MEA3532269.1 hypothetical protein [Nocardia sp. CDC192]MEB3514337.1 hypothetical protein [Nocardia sp. CDC186]